MPAAVRVWDLPTRLFHWLLVGLLAFSWWSGETDRMDWHRLSGTMVLSLIVFRILWGLAGGSTARFSAMVHRPATILAYLRSSRPTAGPGHNPLGGYSAVAMLVLVAVQVGSGLFAVDVDGIESGPLSFLVDFDRGRAAAEFHELSFNLLLGLIGLHILAILFYRVVRKRDLVTAMITGRSTRFDPGDGELEPAGPVRFAIAATLAAGLAWWTSKGFGL